MEYSIERLNEVIELCKVKPRKIHITLDVLKDNMNHKENIIPFVTVNQYNEIIELLLQEVKKDVYNNENIILFFKYIFIFNSNNSYPFFALIEVLEFLKKRFYMNAIKLWIFKLSNLYFKYLSEVDSIHMDIDSILSIRKKNEISIENTDVEMYDIVKKVGTDKQTLLLAPLVPLSFKVTEVSNELISNLKKYLTFNSNSFEHSFNDFNLSFHFISSTLYYLVRDEIYAGRRTNNKFIEASIKGMEDLIKYYIDNSGNFYKTYYIRFGTLISAKNGIKLAYSLDNNIASLESILNDYSNELGFIFNNNIYQIAIGASVKLLEEVVKLQKIYKKLNIDQNIFIYFKKVLLMHLFFLNDNIKNKKVDSEFYDMFILENIAPILGIENFFENSNKNYFMFEEALDKYYNIFNDNYKKTKNSIGLLNYVYDGRRGKNEYTR